MKNPLIYCIFHSAFSTMRKVLGMKKVLGASLILLFMCSIIGQNALVNPASTNLLLGQNGTTDSVSTNLLRDLRSLPSEPLSLDKKLFNFKKAVDYLNRARDCLSGIGCSKRQSYLANYLLGATYGFTTKTVVGAITGDVENSHARPIDLLINELGYRYLVKEKVSLFRCLTFRGCTDQTKRYAFYNLGIWGGRIGAILNYMGIKKARKLYKHQKRKK